VETADEGKPTIAVCPGCTDLARPVARLPVELAATKLVLQRAGLIPERTDR
jgi:hypothetical protein